MHRTSHRPRRPGYTPRRARSRGCSSPFAGTCRVPVVAVEHRRPYRNAFAKAADLRHLMENS
jgi:hypothetical protein